MTLESIGLDITVLVGIVTLTETIKKIDKKDILKKLYVYIPIVFGILGAFLVTNPLTWRSIVINSILYAGVSGYAYDFIKGTFDNLIKNRRK